MEHLKSLHVLLPEFLCAASGNLHRLGWGEGTSRDSIPEDKRPELGALSIGRNQEGASRWNRRLPSAVSSTAPDVMSQLQCFPAVLFLVQATAIWRSPSEVRDSKPQVQR